METIGRYQILEEFGRSQMTVVYRALDTQANREVVVKVFNLEQALDAEAKLSLKAHFRRELKIIASLEHPAIVPVYDVGEHDGQPYYVMRLMAGGSLNKKITAAGRMSLQDVSRIIDRLAPALEHAHKQNIIHRDIKPDNILFDLDGNPYIADFGVAKPAAAEDAANSEGPVGTPEYMSPEQANQELVDERSDVYSLGVTIRQMLTGKKPGQSTGDIISEVPELPSEMSEIMKISLAHDKRDRYVTVNHLARALHRAAFGDDGNSVTLDRHSESAARRSGIIWVVGSVFLLAAFIWIFAQTGNVPFLSPAPTATATLTPLVTVETLVSSPQDSTSDPNITFTPDVSPTPELPAGGADQIALVSGNGIYLMNMDGGGLAQIRSENSPKSNLQWISGKRLIYTSRNCIYVLDAITRQTEQLACFAASETLEGASVSPDEKYIAISVQRTMNILPFDVEFLKTVTSRFELFDVEGDCFYTQFAFRDTLWGLDETQLLAHVISPRFVNSDQLFHLTVDVENCANVEMTRLDIIPGARVEFDNDSNKKIDAYDWNGKNLFLFNDAIRNDGFGDLYLYNNTSQEFTKINPINGECCYRDPRWSPDGKYVMFVFQRFDQSNISLYYVPYTELQSGGPFTPLTIPSGLFATSREKPQPALRPIE